ncbi:MAG: aconitase X catalytic domain-containing protein [Clostridium sp.]|jgi:predicted aconitase|uniref:aconitase X n=1 Tax=Clostridium sp. TaxID=1506 RepID=UPI0025BBC15C|nr:aconitase X [Clostridium sp.]MCH3963528.1 aconitase X catalytic domain-containing protein [Clostridium sp.]MCI1714669.1 aconitase X catalytic domain-containing protein [Clostridium sp.]MCI1799142.1 aconitase X catalytic domain-containing protein [Clostridium sp.]MCI1812852.1 aconitase X catalytic domain-containing protein [Clostridium sp.]MCI1869742.1 aconitase X catalytic domain-containing protein [Clostridium sp.]
MEDYNMELTHEEKEILEGKKGEVMRKALKSVVLYGKAFGAKRLLDIDGPVHLVTSFGMVGLDTVFDMMDEIIGAGIRTKEPFTVDPRPIDYENVECNEVQKKVFGVLYSNQERYETQLKKLGIKNDNAFTCTCYMPEVGNRPEKGQIISWAESSAVVFANSVIGARTNRNSGIIELLCGIVGKVPEFGLVTDKGRRAKWVIQVKTSKLPNAQVLGSAIGMKVVEDVPYIIGLDKFLGKGMNNTTMDYLKDMGAASASNGAVGLYHVENITPEAVEEGRELLEKEYNTYVVDDNEIRNIIESYPVLWENMNARPAVCFIGCPHLSIDQIYDWSDKISSALDKKEKSKVELNTVLSAAPDVISKFRSDEKAYKKLTDMGVHLTYICPLMYMSNPECSKQPVITNSNKLRTYSKARFLLDQDVLYAIVNGDIKGAEKFD